MTWTYVSADYVVSGSASTLQDLWWETVSWNSFSSCLATVLQQLGMAQWVTQLSSEDPDCPAVRYPSSWQLNGQGHSPASENMRCDPACMSLRLSHPCAGPHSWRMDAKDHVISQQEGQLRMSWAGKTATSPVCVILHFRLYELLKTPARHKKFVSFLLFRSYLVVALCCTRSPFVWHDYSKESHCFSNQFW